MFGVSPDGRLLVCGVVKRGSMDLDLMVLPLDAGGQLRPLIQTRFDENHARISPDGRWIAYDSNESGKNEIYVRPFPAVDSGRWPVSKGGGEWPVWSRDGHELFYAATLKPGKIMAVAVQLSASTFTYGKPQTLFDRVNSLDYIYDVSADGKKFLMIKNTPAATSTERPSLTIVTHWIDELKTRVK